MEFEILVDQNDKRYKKNYKLSIDYRIKAHKVIGKIFIRLLNIQCVLLALLSLLLLILRPQDYIHPLLYLMWAFFWSLTPKVLRSITYVKNKKKLTCIIKMKFLQHELISLFPNGEMKIIYNRIKKLVVTDKFLLLYPILSSDRKKRRKQFEFYIPTYVFNNQQLELLKEWINNDIAK
ncbi:hypothetical protein C8E03_11336 [Lachnotalea glycerini]|uniref:Uncharacterized protein n=1 Tax=Lachnotalea glycerini TaxID=1763509 RepID=A0A255IGE8_9FIRM|nr:hypothetical protein [Lachnotalea glycerini]PXV86251.1 hypothetical protein C8E03_11336 [Lachnotalea glycerini]RDY31576.1 hypothetical protein CG710_008920 [Lachnotalea glycerini]